MEDSLKGFTFFYFLLTIFYVSVGAFLFINGNHPLSTFFFVLGFWPLVIIGYFIYEAGYKSGKKLPTEDDLEDETLYGVVETYKQNKEELVLLRNLNNQELRLYRLTCVPANIFRGKDAKNFSRMKKATE